MGMTNTMEKVEEVMYRPADLAFMLGADRQQVYRWIRENRLPSVRLGRAIYVPRAAFERWLEAQNQQALAAVAGVSGATGLAPLEASDTGKER